MKKKLVRCYVGFGNTNQCSNIKIFYVIPEMYAKALYTCINCGEIFVADLEDPAFCNRKIVDVVKGMNCPSCNAELSSTIKCYPQVFRATDGSFGSFNPGKIISPDNASLVREFIEIIPS